MTKIADTLYAKYIKEREGTDVLESEFGFITYRITGAECFIVDMHVDQAARKTGQGRALLEQLSEIAKECHFLTANIWLKKKGSQVSLRGALACGFEVRNANADVLLIAKNLLEDSDGRR